MAIASDQGLLDEAWHPVTPQVNAEAEFFEILNDFGNPIEILREAISNAIDANASLLEVLFDVQEIDGAKRLVIELADNGDGMTYEVLCRDFWGLGYSPSRDARDAHGKKERIGEKGHGTKIYLRSERVEVWTRAEGGGGYYSECDRPLRALSKRQLHEPRVKRADDFLGDKPGTKIRIVGYNDNERSKFRSEIVRDYLLWFTKIGSVEQQFGSSKYESFKVRLKCLDDATYQDIPFGHVFPDENSDITKLFDQHGVSAADWYVKKYLKPLVRLDNHPEVTFNSVIYVEGDEIKRSYNPMLGRRARKDSGRYRVADRYGLWLCKDFIPVVRVNEWITGFGSGSNAFVLLHGFINCQSLKLTANRGTIANTDPIILEELQAKVQQLISDIDAELRTKGIYTLRSWQDEERTLQQEKDEYSRRVKNLKNRKVARLEDRILVEPSNESELFGLFLTVYALHPELFDFEPLDYNTTRGIDIIARNKSKSRITEGDHWYVELKYALGTNFNHAYQHLKYIVCWDFDKSISPSTEFHGVEDADTRQLTIAQVDGHHVYFLDNQRRSNKIEIIRLKEFLANKLSLEFALQPADAG